MSSLLPSVDPCKIIGVRTPALRKYARSLFRSGEHLGFLNSLPHSYYEENNLHAFLIAEVSEFDSSIRLINEFLPHVDNWATCDSLRPKTLAKNADLLPSHIDLWLKSGHTYTVRFAIELLMLYFLDERFDGKHLRRICEISSDEYYVKMMQAWYIATALSKQYEATLPYLTEGRLDLFTHNKAIQKAIESYRISDGQKALLRSLKRK